MKLSNMFKKLSKIMLLLVLVGSVINTYRAAGEVKAEDNAIKFVNGYDKEDIRIIPYSDEAYTVNPDDASGSVNRNVTNQPEEFYYKIIINNIPLNSDVPKISVDPASSVGQLIEGNCVGSGDGQTQECTYTIGKFNGNTTVKVEHQHEHDDNIVFSGVIKDLNDYVYAIENGGNWYLEEDIVLNNDFYDITATKRSNNPFYLCLNGKKLDMRNVKGWSAVKTNTEIDDCGKNPNTYAFEVDTDGSWKLIEDANAISDNVRNVTGGVIVGGDRSYEEIFNIQNGKTLTLSGGNIVGNHSNRSGAIYVDNGTFEMSGGSIVGNKASNGSAIYVNNGTTFRMNGGIISNNVSSSSMGGAVVVGGTSATIEFSENAVITENEDKDNKTSNVKLPTNYLITIGNNGLEDAKIGISSAAVPTDGSNVIFASSTDDYSGNFTSDISGYYVIYDDESDTLQFSTTKPEPKPEGPTNPEEPGDDGVDTSIIQDLSSWVSIIGNQLIITPTDNSVEYFIDSFNYGSVDNYNYYKGLPVETEGDFNNIYKDYADDEESNYVNKGVLTRTIYEGDKVYIATFDRNIIRGGYYAMTGVHAFICESNTPTVNKQPTSSSPTFDIQYGDKATYQWYDENSKQELLVSATQGEDTIQPLDTQWIYEDGVWSLGSNSGLFTINLQKGDVWNINIEEDMYSGDPDDLRAIVLYGNDWDGELLKECFGESSISITITKGGTYAIEIWSVGDELPQGVTSTVTRRTAVAGQTTNTFTGSAGTYVCMANWGNYVLMSNSVTVDDNPPAETFIESVDVQVDWKKVPSLTEGSRELPEFDEMPATVTGDVASLIGAFWGVKLDDSFKITSEDDYYEEALENAGEDDIEDYNNFIEYYKTKYGWAPLERVLSNPYYVINDNDVYSMYVGLEAKKGYTFDGTDGEKYKGNVTSNVGVGSKFIGDSSGKTLAIFFNLGTLDEMEDSKENGGATPPGEVEPEEPEEDTPIYVPVIPSKPAKPAEPTTAVDKLDTTTSNVETIIATGKVEEVNKVVEATLATDYLNVEINANGVQYSATEAEKYDVRIDNLNTVVTAILTDDEIVQAASGELNASILLETEMVIVENISDTTKTKIGDATPVGYQLKETVDISLYKILGSEKTQIKETSAGIEVTMELPESIRNEKNVKIIRIHNEGTPEEEATVLTSVVNGDGTITFVTDKFSTYAFVTSDMDLSAYSNFGLEVYHNSRVISVNNTKNGFDVFGYMWADYVTPTKDTWREIIFVNTEDASTDKAYRMNANAVYNTFLNSNMYATRDGKVDLSYACYKASVNTNSISSYDKKSTGKMASGTYYVFMRISDGKDSYLFPLVDRVLSDGSTMTLPANFSLSDDLTRTLVYTVK